MTTSGTTVALANPTQQVMAYTTVTNPNAVDAFTYAFTGAFVGALRPVSGWFSDKLGGARVTHWATIVMIAAIVVVGCFVSLASGSPAPEKYFGIFFGLFLLLFVTTGMAMAQPFG